jgi:hypothetical protein
LGGAIFGAILTNRLSFHLKQLLPHASLSGNAASLSSSVETGATPTFINKLPHSTSHDIYQAFVLSFHDMFLIAVPVLLVAFVVALFLRESPLRTTTKGPEVI